ncbi:hypothetical protein PHSY_004837 [Pseudozyma hubeiensis SY62]|uniref:Uncharacterized protein n=1 Tax=Pseudozyma hubeiensis (strain SY62) TaxID=1305764 RepID=R9P7L5_PSEHS|nr:hypothetical protein PHSY_004837 [Pseudozyma hubeiensis SY62]GAC97252.1 hypothetical protein PHSY_004837 [Pseudozyma hubeiensis SY62]
MALLPAVSQLQALVFTRVNQIEAFSGTGTIPRAASWTLTTHAPIPLPWLSNQYGIHSRFPAIFAEDRQCRPECFVDLVDLVLNGHDQHRSSGEEIDLTLSSL